MLALLKVESRSLVVTLFLLQRAASNNDTLSLSLLSGVPLHNTMMAKVTVVALHQEMWKIVQQRSVEGKLIEVFKILPDISIMMIPLDSWLCDRFDPIDSHITGQSPMAMAHPQPGSYAKSCLGSS